ncbi:MAG: UPF0755 protein [Parcubacteria group bacterium Gr01-1014_19]|nr:MAG: UPF0755 protein [Parcubacteria group bacterium Gr01-1014_19]
MVYFVSPVEKGGAGQMFIVEKGDGVREIAKSLEESGLIKSPAAFLVYSAVSGSADKLKAGAYDLSPAMNVFHIVDTLRRGPKEDLTIRVGEGDTLAEIEAELVKLKIIKPKALSKFPGKSLEGFLFPDTYRFFPSSSIEDVVKKFMTNFYKQAVPALTQTNDSQLTTNDSGIYEKLIIASILEKEVPFHDDRRLVAGVLYKRLKIGMALQVDAYPWTYEHAGLPPKPISNPGLDAIRAAANPSASDYLYYLSDPVTKKTIFSKTFDEHKTNKLKYLK